MWSDEDIYKYNFERRKNGETLFFLWSKLFKGRFLKTQYQERQLKKLLKFEYMSSFPLLIIIVFVDHIIADILLLGCIAFYCVAVELILADDKEREQ